MRSRLHQSGGCEARCLLQLVFLIGKLPHSPHRTATLSTHTHIYVPSVRPSVMKGKLTSVTYIYVTKRTALSVLERNVADSDKFECKNKFIPVLSS